MAGRTALWKIQCLQCHRFSNVLSLLSILNQFTYTKWCSNCVNHGAHRARIAGVIGGPVLEHMGCMETTSHRNEHIKTVNDLIERQHNELYLIINELNESILIIEPRVTQRTTCKACHYNDVTMSAMASQITSLTIFYSIVYSGANERKHQSPVSLAFVRAIHQWPVNSPRKGPVTRKMFPFDDVIIQSAAVPCRYNAVNVPLLRHCHIQHHVTSCCLITASNKQRVLMHRH